MTFYENNSKYMMVLLLICVCLPYLQMILILVKADPNVQIYIWIITISVMAFCFAYLPLREYLQHQIPTMGKIFAVGPIVYLNYTSRAKVLGFEGEIEEIKIDWTNQGLKILENSRLYLRGKRNVLKTESTLDKEKRQMIQTPEQLKTLTDALNIDMTASPMEQLSELLYGLYKVKIEQLPAPEQKKTKGRKKKKVENSENIDSNVMEQYKQDLALALVKPEADGIIIKEKKKGDTIIKPEFINLIDLGIVEEKQIEYLKTMKFYFGTLYHPESIEGYEHLEFPQVFLIIPGKFSEVLATSEMTVFDYADYLVRVQGCDVMWLCHGFIKGKIPLMHCFASENFLKLQTPESTKALQLKHSTLYYLRIKIMEWLIGKLTAEQDPFQQDINRLEIQTEGLRDRVDFITQEYLSDAFIKAPINVQKENINLREQLAFGKRWKIIAMVFGVIAIILLFAVFFVLVPTINNINNIPRPTP